MLRYTPTGLRVNRPKTTLKEHEAVGKELKHCREAMLGLFDFLNPHFQKNAPVQKHVSRIIKMVTELQSDLEEVMWIDHPEALDSNEAYAYYYGGFQRD